MPRVTITVPEKNAQPYRFQLDREVVTLGRGSENDISIDSGSVSVHHAEMKRIPGGYELHDVGSTNGIKLDGDRRTVIPLRNGASVSIGDVDFDFVLNDEELEILSRENQSDISPVIQEMELPAAKAKPAPPRPAYGSEPSQSTGVVATLLFLVLAALAFFAGLAIRHQKETGKSLIDGMKAKQSAVVAPATPAAPPAAPVVPAQ